MRKKIIFVLTLLSLLISASSCKKSPLTNGKVVTETREISAFDTLYLYDNIDVTLICSDTYKIEITTGENLMPNIISESNGEMLLLRNDNICNWLRSYDCPLKAKIYYKSGIKSIIYESVGDLTSDTYISNDTLSRFDLNIENGSGNIDLKINSDNIYVKTHDGTNEIKMEGIADYIYIYQVGLGPIDILGLPTKKADIYSYGSNDIYVNCSKTLNANIYDLGDIYYKGQPEIKSNISPDALGRIISINN